MNNNMANIENNQTARQLYFIETCKEWAMKQQQELGRPLTACVNTFGCQMNTVTMIMKMLILRHFLKNSRITHLEK